MSLLKQSIFLKRSSFTFRYCIRPTAIALLRHRRGYHNLSYIASRSVKASTNSDPLRYFFPFFLHCKKMDVADAFFGADVIHHQASLDSMDGFEEADEMRGIMKLESIWREVPSDREMALTSVAAFEQKHNHTHQPLHRPTHKAENQIQKAETIHHSHHSPDPLPSSTLSSADLDQIIFYAQSTSIANTEAAVELMTSNQDIRGSSGRATPANNEQSHAANTLRDASPSTTAENSPLPSLINILEQEEENNLPQSPVSPWMNEKENNELRASDDGERLLVPLRKLEINVEEAKLEQLKPKSVERSKSLPRLSTVSVHRDNNTDSPTQKMIQSKPSLSSRCNTAPNLNFIPLGSAADPVRSKTPSPKNTITPTSNSSINNKSTRSMSPSNIPRRSAPSPKASSSSRPTSPSVTKTVSAIPTTRANNNTPTRPVSPAAVKPVGNKGTTNNATSAASPLTTKPLLSTPQKTQDIVESTTLPIPVSSTGVVNHEPSLRADSRSSSSDSTNKEGFSVLSSLSSSTSHNDLHHLVPEEAPVPITPQQDRMNEMMIKPTPSTEPKAVVGRGSVGGNEKKPATANKTTSTSAAVKPTKPAPNATNTGSTVRRSIGTGTTPQNSSIPQRHVSSEDIWPANGRVRHQKTSANATPNKQPITTASPMKAWK